MEHLGDLFGHLVNSAPSAERKDIANDPLKATALLGIDTRTKTIKWCTANRVLDVSSETRTLLFWVCT